MILLPEATAIHEPWLRERPGDYAALTRRAPAARDVPVAAATTCRRSGGGARWSAAVEAAFQDVDLLLCASSMDVACRIDDPEAVERTYPRQARTPFNVTGHPALSVMCGVSKAEGLPIGMQLVGPSFSEALIYRAAAAYERAAPWAAMAPALG